MIDVAANPGTNSCIAAAWASYGSDFVGYALLHTLHSIVLLDYFSQLYR